MSRGVKLNKKERQELMIELCQALCTLKTTEEVAEVLTDLLYPQETESIAKRLKIAELLVKGNNYHSIRLALKVGYSTIARVNTWLNLSGKGFKILLSRKKSSSKPNESTLEEKYDPLSWYNVKRRYSLYFWPELLLETLIKESNKRGKDRIIKALEKLNLKTSTFNSEANKALFESFTDELKRRE